MTQEGKPLLAELKRATTTAEATLARVDRLAASAEPGISNLSSQTVPQVNQLVADLRDLSEQLNRLTTRLNNDPATALDGDRALPDYQPRGKKK